MKKNLYHFCFTLLIIVLSVHSYAQTYCAVSFPNGVTPITEVRLGYMFTHTSMSGMGYEDFSTTIDTVYSGTTYTMVVMGNTGGNFTDSVVAFFDWNQNGNFLDAGERFPIGTITNSTGNIVQAAIANITVGLNLGSVRMRIIKKRNGGISSCNNTGEGQAEDYTLYVQQGMPCAGTPVPGTVTTSPNYLCNNVPFVLSTSNHTLANNIYFQWEMSTAPGIWNIISGATTTTYIIQGITAPTQFRVSAYCPNCGLDYSYPVTVQSAHAAFTSNSPVCIGDTINVSMNSCINCLVSINGPNNFNDSQGFTLTNVHLNQKGWYVFTVTDSFCNTSSQPDSFYIDISNCQDSVWPGDVNHDLITNYLDFLFFTVPANTPNAYYGPPRKNPTINYIAQACPDWSTSVSNVNRKHADCDGNGMINLSDTIAISTNYNMPHPKGVFTPKPKIASQPDLYFDTTSIQFLPNTTVTIPAMIGSFFYPMSNIYGIGGELKMLSSNAASFYISDTNNFLGNPLFKFKRQGSSAQEDFVYSRYYLVTNIGGYGPLLNVVLSLPPNSAGDTVTLYFDNVTIINNAGTVITNYNVIPLTFVIKDPLGINEVEKNLFAAIIPNPSQENAQLNLDLENTDVTVSVSDITGKQLWQWKQRNIGGHLNIVLPQHLSQGVYIVAVKTKNAGVKILRWVKH